MRALVSVSLTVLASALTACGGDDAATDASKHRTSAASRPSRAEDRAAVEQVLLAYGAATGAKSCDYLAQNEITHLGGIASCRHKNADLSAEVFKVENVVVNGDTANAVITTQGHKSYYELVRERRSAGIAGGWKISSFPQDGLTRGPRTTQPAPATESPAANARAEVKRLLVDFGQASGSDVCKFFSQELIAKRGGQQVCEKYFAGRPALHSKIIMLHMTLPAGKQDVLPSATAVIKSGTSGQNLYLGLNQTGDALDRYGGWKITRQGQ